MVMIVKVSSVSMAIAAGVAEVALVPIGWNAVMSAAVGLALPICGQAV